MTILYYGTPGPHAPPGPDGLRSSSCTTGSGRFNNGRFGGYHRNVDQRDEDKHVDKEVDPVDDRLHLVGGLLLKRSKKFILKSHMCELRDPLQGCGHSFFE